MPHPENYIKDCSGNKKWNVPFQGKGKRLANHRGRWNWGFSNTKLYPVNSIEKDANGNTVKIKQSKNIFRQTSYAMPKAELYKYLSTNRNYWRR